MKSPVRLALISGLLLAFVTVKAANASTIVFTDRVSFGVAVDADPSLTKTVEGWDALAAGTLLPNGTSLNGITYTGGFSTVSAFVTTGVSYTHSSLGLLQVNPLSGSALGRTPCLLATCSHASPGLFDGTDTNHVHFRGTDFGVRGFDAEWHKPGSLHSPCNSRSSEFCCATCRGQSISRPINWSFHRDGLDESVHVGPDEWGEWLHWFPL